MDHPESVSTDMEIPLWASQIALGMIYLQDKKFVHRDLGKVDRLTGFLERQRLPGRVLISKCKYFSLQISLWEISI